MQPDFPHGLRVRVIEHQPAAIAVGDAGRVPVAGDGTILRGLPVEGTPARRSTSTGRSAATACWMLTARRLRRRGRWRAPDGCAPRVEDVQARPGEGSWSQLRDGPELIFGAATRLRAKWAAAVRVLADLEAAGASYIDLRIPGRPAAGGLAATTRRRPWPRRGAAGQPAPGRDHARPASSRPPTPPRSPKRRRTTLPAEPERPAATPPAGTAEPTVPRRRRPRRPHAGRRGRRGQSAP